LGGLEKENRQNFCTREKELRTQQGYGTNFEKEKEQRKRTKTTTTLPRKAKGVCNVNLLLPRKVPLRKRESGIVLERKNGVGSIPRAKVCEKEEAGQRHRTYLSAPNGEKLRKTLGTGKGKSPSHRLRKRGRPNTGGEANSRGKKGTQRNKGGKKKETRKEKRESR